MSIGENKPKSKVYVIICTVLTAIIAVFTLIILVNIIVCRVKNKPVSFFGTSVAIVQTGSMEPYIKVGDLIVIREAKYEDVKKGDYVVFIAGDGFGKLKGQSIVHEAIDITPEGIVTQGKNAQTNPVPDADYVTSDNLIGVCTANSAGWGKVFSFIGKYGIIIIIAIIAVPFIVKQIIKIVKLSKQAKAEGEATEAVTDGGDAPSVGNGKIIEITDEENRFGDADGAADKENSGGDKGDGADNL